MKPMIGFLKTIWTMSVYIKENFKKWIGCISGAAKGLVGVITGAKSLSAVLSGIMAKSTITANMLTLGIATGIFALSLYLVNVVDRTLNRKINQSLDKLEQQTKKASDTMKNAFIQPTQDTAKMKDNMSSVADSTKKIKDNLQSFDVIHAIEQQAEMVAPETIIDIEMQDYSKFLDNLVKEATNIDTSITSAVIPKLEDMSIKLGDILETIKQDVSGFFGNVNSGLSLVKEAVINSANALLEAIGLRDKDAAEFEKLRKEILSELNEFREKSKNIPPSILESIRNISMPKFVETSVTTHGYIPSAFQPAIAEPKINLEIKESKGEYPDFLTREYYINGNRVKTRP